LDSVAGSTIRPLHDRGIPGRRTNIDHLVVCPSGVLVIDAKHYQGRPERRVQGGLIRPRTETLIVARRDRTRLVDGVHRQVEHVRAVLDDGALFALPVRGMLCFINADWPLLGASFSIDWVQVLWPRKAVAELRRPGPLTGTAIEAVYQLLKARFPSAV
jgi:hypothetical protein